MSVTRLQIATQYFKGLIYTEINNIVRNDLMMKTIEKKFNAAWDEFTKGLVNPDFLLKTSGLTKINYHTSPEHFTSALNKSKVINRLWWHLPEEGMTSWPDIIIWDEATNTVWILIN